MAHLTMMYITYNTKRRGKKNNASMYDIVDMVYRAYCTSSKDWSSKISCRSGDKFHTDVHYAIYTVFTHVADGQSTHRQTVLSLRLLGMIEIYLEHKMENTTSSFGRSL